MTALEVGRESVIEAECFAELSQAFLLLFQLNIEEKRWAAQNVLYVR